MYNCAAFNSIGAIYLPTAAASHSCLLLAEYSLPLDMLCRLSAFHLAHVGKGQLVVKVFPYSRGGAFWQDLNGWDRSLAAFQTREPLSQLPKLLSVSFLGHGAGSLSPSLHSWENYRWCETISQVCHNM